MKILMLICCAAMVAFGAMAESVATNGYTWTYSVVDGKATNILSMNWWTNIRSEMKQGRLVFRWGR